MLIFIILLTSALKFASLIVNGFFASAEAIYSICALLIFAFIAIAIGMRNNRAWTYMFLTIFVMVAAEMLSPFSDFITVAIAVVIAIIGTIAIKRPMLDYVRRDAHRPANLGGPRLTPIARTVLTWI